VTERRFGAPAYGKGAQQMPHSKNALLSSLSLQDRELVHPHLKIAEMTQGQVLAQTHDRVELAHFPHSGIISFVVELKDGMGLETGMVGRDGLFGGSQALDDKLALNKVVVQVAGMASVITSDRLHELALGSCSFREIIVKYEQFFLAQVQQSVACNGAHAVEQRMCRWLLRMHELVGSDLPLTQEFLAQMMGVTRPSVSHVAAQLQKAGLIKYSRGHLQITDLERVRETACECHGTVVWHHRAIFNTGADDLAVA
jgi:CRP-like cAMP-binding protein